MLKGARQNLTMANNKRCLRTMSKCPHISVAWAEQAQRGQPISEGVLFSISIKILWLSLGSCREIQRYNKAPLWEFQEEDAVKMSLSYRPNTLIYF